MFTAAGRRIYEVAHAESLVFNLVYTVRNSISGKLIEPRRPERVLNPYFREIYVFNRGSGSRYPESHCA